MPCDHSQPVGEPLSPPQTSVSTFNVCGLKFNFSPDSLLELLDICFILLFIVCAFQLFQDLWTFIEKNA